MLEMPVNERTYRLDVDARESLNKVRHYGRVIVDAFEEHRLVANDHPVLE